jgi:hypothetical protein
VGEKSRRGLIIIAASIPLSESTRELRQLIGRELVAGGTQQIPKFPDGLGFGTGDISEQVDPFIDFRQGTFSVGQPFFDDVPHPADCFAGSQKNRHQNRCRSFTERRIHEVFSLFPG